MVSRFMGMTTPGALGIVLVVPLYKRGSNSTVFGCCFGDPHPVINRERWDDCLRCNPVNLVGGFGRYVAFATPPELGDGVMDFLINVMRGRTYHLVGTTPELPSFVLDVAYGRKRNARRVV